MLSPTDCPGVLLLDQCLPPDTQCQFILKPNKAVLGQTQLLGKGFHSQYVSGIWLCLLVVGIKITSTIKYLKLIVWGLKR